MWSSRCIGQTHNNNNEDNLNKISLMIVLFVLCSSSPRISAGRIPSLHQLSPTPPISSSHAITPRVGLTTSPLFQYDVSFGFHDFQDHISFLIVDASAGAAGAGTRLIGAVSIPCTEVQERHLDRWFDLMLPIPPVSHHQLQQNPLSAWVTDSKSNDAILQIGPINTHSSSAPIGRIRLQMFHTLSSQHHVSPSLQPRLSMSFFPEELQSIRLKVITWNVGNAALPSDISAFLPSDEPTPDLVAIGLQECSFDPDAKDISGQMLVTNGCEASVISSFIRLLPACFERIHVHSLWEMRLLLFIRRDLRSLVRQLTFDAVATGVGNVVANKGAIVASMKLRDTKIAFVTGHLAAHTDKLQQRNKDLALIIKSVAWTWEDGDSNPAVSATTTPQAYTDLLSNFHHVFLFGDLNYRLEWPPGCTDRSPTPAAFKHIVGLVKAGAYDDLLSMDQLRAQQRLGRAFSGFKEGSMQFQPSFKVLRNVGLGYTAKRLPSYTDRVLWRSVFEDKSHAKSPNEEKQPSKHHAYLLVSTPSTSLPSASLQQVSLNLVTALMTSDHKPVHSTFLLPIISLAGRFDYSSGAAAFSVKQLSFTPAPMTSMISPSASMTDSMTLEIRAPFLKEPILTSWRERYLLSELLLPILYNNSARIQRELILMRVFKPLSNMAAIPSSAVPLARGCGVLVSSTSTNQPIDHAHTVEQFDLHVMLTESGVLFGEIDAKFTIQWKRLNREEGGKTPAVARTPVHSKQPTPHSTSSSSLNRSHHSDDDEEDEDELHEPITMPFSLPIMLNKSKPTRSMLVTQKPASILSTPKKRNPTNHAHQLMETLDSRSITQRLQQEHKSSKISNSVSPPGITSIHPVTTLIGMLTISEEVYSHSLRILQQQYYQPISTMFQPESRSSSPADFNSTSYGVISSIFSNLPLLSHIHASFFHELEAQLRLLNFDASSSLPSAALTQIGELFQHFLPMFSVYRWTIYVFNQMDQSILDEHASISAKDPIKQQVLTTIRNKIVEIDATRTTTLEFASLLALPIQRLSTYHLFLREVLKSIRDDAAASSQLVQLYSDLDGGLGQLEQQVNEFSTWYPSLALAEQAQSDYQFYYELAHEAVSTSSSTVSSRPSPAPNQPLHTSLRPPSTGFRPATSYGQSGRQDQLVVEEENKVSDRATSILPHQLIQQIQAQLKSRKPLSGFYPYSSAGATHTQEDITLQFRHPPSSSSFRISMRARAMSLSSFGLFELISARPESSLLITSPTSTNRPLSSSTSRDWSLDRLAQRLGLGNQSLNQISHWSHSLPATLRQSGRAFIQLIDLRSSIVPSSGFSPVPSSSSPLTITTTDDLDLGLDDYDADEFEPVDDGGEVEDVDNSLDLSFASEQLQAVLAASKRANQRMQSTTPMTPSRLPTASTSFPTSPLQSRSSASSSVNSSVLSSVRNTPILIQSPTSPRPQGTNRSNKASASITIAQKSILNTKPSTLSNPIISPVSPRPIVRTASLRHPGSSVRSSMVGLTSFDPSLSTNTFIKRLNQPTHPTTHTTNRSK